MPGPNDPAAAAQAEAPKSLREIAEAAYDEVEALASDDPGPGPDDDAGGDEPLASGAQPRDKTNGRWVAKTAQPGEAIGDKPDPAPKAPVSETQGQQPDPAAAQAARSNQAPEHWSAEDKASFAKLAPEGQAFLLKRHGDMEAEFTRKSQASAGAVQFAQSLAPVFTNPAISGDMQRAGMNPSQLVQQWAGFHQRAVSPNQQDRFGLLVEMTERMGLDPARIFVALNQPSALAIPPGMSEEDMKDPAVRFFADHLGRTTNELNALKGELQQIRASETKAREEQGVKYARSNIDQFADEKGPDGKPLRPHFDAVLPLIVDMFKARPDRDLAEAYDAACWAHPEVRTKLLAADRAVAQSQVDVQRARAAQRGNARGLTGPVARPNGADGPSKGSLRDTIERSADEIGY